ncbi:MAG: hypothetical protein PHR06_09325 [Candidatus Cloacimonetes bacterium]|nr:hypothetical protein [Candidatus Cloacimonadota bacterium]
MLSEQNFFLKLSFVILVSVIVSISTPFYQMILFLINVVYFLPDVKILYLWLRTLLKIIPFFIGIVLLSLLFTNGLYTQLLLCLRIALLILLSVYLVTSTNRESFINDSGRLIKYRWYMNLVLYFSSVFHFIKCFSGITAETDKKSFISEFKSRIKLALESVTDEITNVSVPLQTKGIITNFRANSYMLLFGFLNLAIYLFLDMKSFSLV